MVKCPSCGSTLIKDMAEGRDTELLVRVSGIDAPMPVKIYICEICKNLWFFFEGGNQ